MARKILLTQRQGTTERTESLPTERRLPAGRRPTPVKTGAKTVTTNQVILQARLGNRGYGVVRIPRLRKESANSRENGS